MFVGSRRLTLCLVLTASLLLSPAAAAQTASGDWSAVKAVETGSKLSVKLKTGKTVEGRLAGVTDDGLSLAVRNEHTDLKREEVQSVYQVRGRSATKATLVGLGIGAGAGAAIGLAADSSSDSGSFEKIDHVAAAGITVLGAAAGALTGYFLGRRGGKRVLVYEAR
ncbi:MAG: hypothetical protein JOZ96_07260 [Acidobacteria bacterium]|nr:hypothetical protein [Acidobacteriota bacterium]